jgi:hypothetical protein
MIYPFEGEASIGFDIGGTYWLLEKLGITPA